MTISTIDFLVNKKDLHQTRFVSGERDADTLAPGQVLFRVAKFSFSANNITYALLGDSFKYWQFFPTDEEGWGKLPVWGFGDVIESRHEQVAVGDRLFGYFPLATHLVIEAGNLTPRSFVDVAAHRHELSPIYNQYSHIEDSAGDAQSEALFALLRPLFVTAFLLDDYLADNDFFASEAVILTSASSKTAYATAFLLNENRAERSAYEIVGLTSAGNIDFVKGLGCYDRVLAYDDVEQLAADRAVSLVDFSGNGELVGRLHQHYQDQMKYSGLIGLSHQGGVNAREGLPGVRPTVFFAPTQIQKRLGDWGGREYVMRVERAWDAFMDRVKDWVTIEERSGMDAIESVYSAFLQGDVSPGQGFILSF